MAANSRFAVALHVLGFMAYTAGNTNTSEQIAGSVNTNPVVIRRLLASLREAGLVVSQPGPGGGWQLTRASDQITLADVYRAVDDDPLFTLPTSAPEDHCEVGAHVLNVLHRLNAEAETALTAHLDKTSVGDIVVEIARQVGPCPLEYVAHRHHHEGDHGPCNQPSEDYAAGSPIPTRSGSH